MPELNLGSRFNLKVAILLPQNGTGGTEKQVTLLVKLLQQNKVHCQVIYLRETEGSVFLPGKSAGELFKFPLVPTNLRYLWQATKLIRFLRHNEIQIVLSFLPETIVVAQFALRQFLKNTTFVSCVRGEFIHHKRKALSKFFYKLSLCRSEFVICNSTSLVEYVANNFHVKRERLFYIPNGLRIKHLSNPRVSSKITRAIVISNFHIYKGFDILLEALGKVSSQLEVHILGSGLFSNYFLQQAKGVPKNISIFLHGQQNPEEYLLNSSFAIHPSKTEGQSNAILEELSYGLPVIAFNVGGNNALVEDRVNGILLDNLDSQQLAIAIDYLSTNPDFCKILSNSAFEKAKEFSPNKLVLNHLNLYRRIMEQQQRSTS